MEKATAYKVNRGWLVIGATHLNSFNKECLEIEIDITKNEKNNLTYKELRNAGILERETEKSTMQREYQFNMKQHKEFTETFNIPAINSIDQFIALLGDDKVFKFGVN